MQNAMNLEKYLSRVFDFHFQVKEMAPFCFPNTEAILLQWNDDLFPLETGKSPSVRFLTMLDFFSVFSLVGPSKKRRGQITYLDIICGLSVVCVCTCGCMCTAMLKPWISLRYCQVRLCGQIESCIRKWRKSWITLEKEICKHSSREGIM